MIVTCGICNKTYDDYDHWTYCPHKWFPPAKEVNKLAMCMYDEIQAAIKDDKNIQTFDCCECGRPIVRFGDSFKDTNLCIQCISMPGWFDNLKLVEIFDPDNKRKIIKYVCVNGHDRCNQMYAGPDCPYCERRVNQT